MNSKEISYLKELNQVQWLDLIERSLMYKSLPIANVKNTASEFLISINNELLQNKELDTTLKFQRYLLEYYFNLRSESIDNEKIYNLHYIFSAIKPKIDIVERLELQFTREVLRKQYYDGISLHASLLALLIDLEIINKDRIRHYLNQCEYTNFELSFARVSLRFFIKNGFITEYFSHFKKIATLNNDKRLAELLGKSILELRDYLGSFSEIYRWIHSKWSEFVKDELLRTNILSYLDNYLHYENNQFLSDGYAKLLKCFIIKNKYLIPPKLIIDILEYLYNLEYEQHRKGLLLILKNYFLENIACFDGKREKLRIDSYDERLFVYCLEIKDSKIFEDSFKIKGDKLLNQVIKECYYKILTSFLPENIYEKLLSIVEKIIPLSIEEKPEHCYEELIHAA